MTAQTVFRTALLDPAAAVPAGLTGPAGGPATRRFAVYRNNVAVSLTEALEAGFPVLRKLLGVEFFAAMAGVFLRAHPPRSPLMMHYGAEMPAFLETFAPVAHLPYLPDIARLELALRGSYHAADARPLRAEAVAALPPDRLAAARLRLAPSLRLVRSAWPIHAIWSANTGNAPDHDPVHDKRGTGSGAQDVAVLRPALDPVPHLLPDGAGAILAALMAGTALGEAAGIGPEAALPPLLMLLLSQGAIIDTD